MAEPSPVGLLLRQKREELRLTRPAVANLVGHGISARLLESWETGETRTLPLDGVVRVARILCIPPSELQAVALGTPLMASALTASGENGSDPGADDLDGLAAAVEEAARRLERLRLQRANRQRSR